MNYRELTTSAPKVLVEFYASWCPHCQRMMPIVADVKEKIGKTVPVAQFDIDENTELSDMEKVASIPTFIIYKDGKEVWRNTGEMAEADLLRAVEEA